MITEYITKAYRAHRANGQSAASAFAHAKRAQEIRTFESAHVIGYSGKGMTIELDGWEYTIDASYDIDGDIDDFECYDESAMDAFRDNEWHYTVITVTASNGTLEGTDSLGGVENGYYWTRITGMDEDQQILSYVLEYSMMETARMEATPAKCGECGREL